MTNDSEPAIFFSFFLLIELSSSGFYTSWPSIHLRRIQTDTLQGTLSDH